MSRHSKNIEQIRNLLRQMDRSIDHARAKREGVPSSPTNDDRVGGYSDGASNGSGASQLIGNSSPTNLRPPAATPPQRSYPPPQPPTNSAFDGGTSSGSGGANQPQRLKAKPKRPPSDPLQDFQQRQAS